MKAALADCVALSVKASALVEEAEGVAAELGVSVPEPDAVRERAAERVPEPDLVTDADADAVTDADGVMERVNLMVAVPEAEAVPASVREDFEVAVALAEPEPEADAEPVFEGDAVALVAAEEV